MTARRAVARCALLMLAPAALRAQTSVAITHVSVIDVVAGVAVPDRTVIVRGARIAAIGPSRTPVAGADTTIDGRGKFLIPGLWDMHAHVDDGGRWQFPMSIAMGVTGLRDMGSALPRLEEWRRERRAGALMPRIVAAGPIVIGVSADTDSRLVRITTPADADRAVDSLARRGVDFIKVYDWIPRDAYLALAAAARRHHLPIAGHLPLAVDVMTAIAAGQRSIEHDGNSEGGLLLYASTDAPRYVTAARALVGRPFDPAKMIGGWSPAEVRAFVASLSDVKMDSLAALLARAGTFVTPTIVGYSTPYFLPVDSALLRDPRRRYLPPAFRDIEDGGVRDYWAHPPSAAVAAAHADIVAARRRLIAALARGGVRLLAGTDFSPWPGAYPGYALHDELRALVAAGLTPAAALRAATSDAAAYLGADSLGTVSAGALADLVLLDADPLADIANTTRISAVILNGQVVDGSRRRALMVRAGLSAGTNFLPPPTRPAREPLVTFGVRVVHLADLHLGYRQYHRQTPTGINQREADVAMAFRRAIDRVVELRPEVVIIAGDVFHSVRPMNPAIIDAFSQFARLTQSLPDADVVMIAGNHDRPRSTETGCILKLFSRLGIEVVVDEPRQLRSKKHDDLSIFAVPDTNAPYPAFEPDRTREFNILVVHGEIEGTFSEFQQWPGRATVEIPLKDLAPERWSYVALGHYHVHHQVAPNAYYSGALEYTSTNTWAEREEERERKIKGKGFVEYDLETREMHFHDVALSRPLLDLPVLSARGLSAAELDAAILARVTACDGGIDDKIVRLVVRDVPRHIAREIDHKAVRDLKRRALNFQLDLRRPEQIRTSIGGAPGRRPTLRDIVKHYLDTRLVDAEIDRGALVGLGLRYLEDADAAVAVQPQPPAPTLLPADGS